MFFRTFIVAIKVRKVRSKLMMLTQKPIYCNDKGIDAEFMATLLSFVFFNILT